MSSHVNDLNTLNKVLTAKLLRQGYRYHKLRKVFSKFYRRHFDIVSKYNVGLKTLLLQGLSHRVQTCVNISFNSRIICAQQQNKGLHIFRCVKANTLLRLNFVTLIRFVDWNIKI